MKRLALVLLVVVLCVALLCLGASQKLVNQTGAAASGVTLTFSDAVRVTSYDKSVFPNRSPASGEAESFTFNGGTLAAGGTFQVTWSPSSQKLIGTRWKAIAGSNGGSKTTLPADWDTAYSYNPDFYVGGWVCDYLVMQKWLNLWHNANPLEIMKANGFEWVKVGLTTVSSSPLRDTSPDRWPALPWKNEYWSSLEYAAEILSQAAGYGLRLSAVLYLSDTSAHAGKQQLPGDWKDLGSAQLLARLESYCYDTVVYFRERALNVEIWEIGNEIERGVVGLLAGQTVAIPRWVMDPESEIRFLRTSVWNLEAERLAAAIRGVRRGAPGAKIVLHVNSLAQTADYARAFFETMIGLGVDFDYAGLSLPYPHEGWRLGRMARADWYGELGATVQFIASLGKDTIIGEGAYPSTAVGISGTPMPDYPYSLEGQAAWVHDALRFARNCPHVKGFFYFYPDWFPGMNPDPSTPLDLQAYGLFGSEGVPKSAMSEFRVNLPSG